MDTRWSIQLLGGLRAQQGTRVVGRFRSRKIGALLAYLAFYRDRSHPRETLIDLFWAESDLEHGRRSLRQALTLLRHALETPGLPDGTLIQADHSSVRLNPAEVVTDVAEFAGALQAAEAAGTEAERAIHLARAVELYAGESLPGYYEEWILAERERLASVYAQTLHQLIGHLEKAGDFRRALDHAQRAVSADPLREEAHRAVMRLYLALGQRSAARSQFHELKRLLHEELGTTPSAATQALAREIEVPRSGIPASGRSGAPAFGRSDRDDEQRTARNERSARPSPNARVSECPHAGTPERPAPIPIGITAYRLFQQSLAEALPEPLPASTPGEACFTTLLFATVGKNGAANRDLVPEDATVLGIRAIVDVLLKYEGRVVPPPSSASDLLRREEGVLVAFGAPRAHEDDAERAIRAALEIRRAAQPLGLQVTAAIHTGDIFLGRGASVADDEQPPDTRPSPVVDRTVRLHQHGLRGQILVSDATHRLTHRAFRFAPCLVARTDAAGPVTAYEVVDALARPAKARGIPGVGAELIGRDEELTKLRMALQSVGKGQGQVVALIGEAGVGKSRLVSELKLAVPSAQCPVPSEGAAGTSASEQLPSGLGTGHRALGTAPEPLWLEGRCLELGMSAGYRLFADILRRYLGAHSHENGPALGDRLVACLGELVQQGDLSAERVEEMGPLLGNLLSIRFGNDWDLRLKNAGPEQIRYQTLVALRDFFVTLAGRQPVILVCEDLHWADSLSLDAISFLMESLPRPLGLLLLLVYRPEREARCRRLEADALRKHRDRYIEIHLQELTPPQSHQLVHALLGHEPLPASVEERLLSRARGNPFFLEELIRSLIASGVLYRDGRTWRARDTGGAGARQPGTHGRAVGGGPVPGQRGASVPIHTDEEPRGEADGEETAVPESIRSVIRSRLDRLEAALKSLLQRAAVIGPLFRPRVLAAMMRAGDGPDVEQALWELEEQGVIYRERVAPEEEYSFQHVLTAETIYQSLSPRRRAGLHEQVAETIAALYPLEREANCELLAYHYERSSADEKAVEYLLRAGEKSRRAYLNEAALGCFTRALERLDHLGSRISAPASHRDRPDETAQSASVLRWRLAALAGLGQVYHGTGREREAEERFRQAIAVAREMALAPREIARLYYRLARALYWQSRHDEASALGEEGLALLGDDRESVEAALMNETVASSCYPKGKRERWSEFALRNAPFLLRLPYEEELRLAYTQIATYYLYHGGSVEEGLGWLRELERKAQEHRDLRALADVAYMMGRFLSLIGDLRGAIPRLEQAVQRSREIGDAQHEAACQLSLGGSLLMLGELPGAAECQLRAIRLAEALGDRSHPAVAHLFLGSIRLCQGSWQRAARAFERCRQLYQEAGAESGVASALCGAGQALLARGKRAEAYRSFRAAFAHAKGSAATLQFVLSGLEEAAESDTAFRADCARLRAEHPEAGDAFFQQWFLEPTEPDRAWAEREVCFSAEAADGRGGGGKDTGWVWHDPFGDGSLRMESGLEIHAPCGRDLRGINVSAPRVLRPVRGEFALQTLCGPATPDRPARGGIVLWKDERNLLLLERGLIGPREITLQRYVEVKGGAQLEYNGRGSLPAEHFFLRLERRGNRVTGLCSADGERWFRVGQLEFAVAPPVAVGVFAAGTIHAPEVFRVVSPEGTAIRFEAVELWC